MALCRFLAALALPKGPQAGHLTTAPAARPPCLLQVPNAWDVFHNNDAVAVEGKGLFLYKRAAHRVVLTPTRDLIVRPSHLEATMQVGVQCLVSGYQRYLIPRVMLYGYDCGLLSVTAAQPAPPCLGWHV